MERLQALHRQGDLLGAYREGERALTQLGATSQLLHMVGVIACQAGEPARGAELLRSALEIRPEPTLYLNLARALLDCGQFEEAEKICLAGTGASLLAGPLTRIHAEILRASGRPREAVALYRRLVAANANDFEAWNNLGNALHDAAELDDAILALVRARVLQPRAPTVRLNLARALAAARRFEQALAELSEAIRLAPDDPEPFLAKGQLLNRLHSYQEALPLLGTAARLRRDDPKIFLAIGIAFCGLHAFGRGEEAYRMALRVDPRSVAAYLALGLLLEQGNRGEDIHQLCKVALAHGVPEQELAYLQALTLRREGRAAEALERALAAPPTIDNNIRAQLIGQLADRLGLEEQAFAAFVDMNDTLRNDPSAVHYPPKGYRQMIEALSELTTPAWYREWTSVSPEIDRPAPVFLVGFPRSGTTLLDTLLMGHPDTVVLEEQPMLEHVRDRVPDMAAVAKLDEAAITELRTQYFAELDAKEPQAHDKLVIDKLPLHFLRAPLIRRIFPDARFVFAQRHPCDVVLSCFMQNFELNRAMSSFMTLEDGALLYDRVLTYWEQVQAVFAMPTRTIVYERMVNDIEAEVRPLIDFLGLPWNPAVLDHTATARQRGHIATPSYAQVTEGLYLRSAGRWEKYRSQMASVLPILAPWVERLGYEPIAI